MRAAVYFGRHDVRIIDFQEPPLTDTGVKVAVSYCGLCGIYINTMDWVDHVRLYLPWFLDMKQVELLLKQEET